MVNKSFLVVLTLFCAGIVGAKEVYIIMQNGERMLAKSLPWFKYVFVDGVDTLDGRSFVVYSSRQYCPTGYAYRYGGTFKAMHDLAFSNCSKIQAGKLRDVGVMSDDLCNCVPLLEGGSNNVNDSSYWRSLNDAALLSGDVKFLMHLVDKNERLPILGVVSEEISGFYGLDGREICRFQFSDVVSYAGSPLDILLKQGRVNVLCVNNESGYFDLSNISLNWFTKKLSGSGRLFLNGGTYEVQP